MMLPPIMPPPPPPPPIIPHTYHPTSHSASTVSYTSTHRTPTTQPHTAPPRSAILPHTAHLPPTLTQRLHGQLYFHTPHTYHPPSHSASTVSYTSTHRTPTTQPHTAPPRSAILP